MIIIVYKDYISDKTKERIRNEILNNDIVILSGDPSVYVIDEYYIEEGDDEQL